MVKSDVRLVAHRDGRSRAVLRVHFSNACGRIGGQEASTCARACLIQRSSVTECMLLRVDDVPIFAMAVTSSTCPGPSLSRTMPSSAGQRPCIRHVGTRRQTLSASALAVIPANVQRVPRAGPYLLRQVHKVPDLELLRCLWRVHDAQRA